MSSQRKTLKEQIIEEGREAMVAADDRVRMLTKENEMLKRKLRDADGKTAIYVQQAKDLLDNIGEFKLTPPQVSEPDRRRGLREEQPVLCLGDTHFGHWEPSGEHKFDKEIARERMLQATQKFIATTHDRRNSAKIDKCHLYFMGDMVEGEMMRNGQAHEIDVPVFLQAMFYAPAAMAECVISLAAEFAELHVVGVPGNHGRNGRFGNGAHHMTNWDRVAYQTCRYMVENSLLKMGSLGEKLWKRITWDLPTDRSMDAECPHDDYLAIDYVYEWCNCVAHGENLRGKGWGGIPFYGVERMVNRYDAILDDPIDFLYMGHIHVHASIPSNYRQVFVNGAIESSTGFVRKDLMSANPPSQTAIFYDPELGPISEHTFYLCDRMPSGQRVMSALRNRGLVKS